MLVPIPYCQHCCKPIPQKYSSWGKCHDCHKDPSLRDRLPSKMVAATLYVPKVVTGYNHNKELIALKEQGLYADEYAEVIGELLRREECDASSCMIVPLPQTESRAEIAGPKALAASISRLTGAVLYDCLYFNRPVKRQKKLNKAEREENMRGAMSARLPRSSDKVLLVDDVMTSGATMREGTRVFRTEGAEEVVGVVAGRDAGIRSLEFAGVVKRVED